VVHHGTFTRYPMLVVNKLGVKVPLGFAWNVNKIDDAVSSIVPGLRRLGSSIALLGTKGAAT
jgi:hypothetical protein